MPKHPQTPEVPVLLNDIQAWFSRLRFAPDADSQAKWMDEADRFLTASKTMSARERLEVYVHDYWPRCLDSLADDFPGLRRFMGEARFSTWMVHYLESFPSRSYSLYLLPEQMPQFFNDQYKEADREMVFELIRYEWAIAQSGFAPSKKKFNVNVLSKNEKQQLASRVFTFQSHVFIESFSYDFLTWLNSGKAKKPSQKFAAYIVYREASGVKILALSRPHFLVLNGLQKGLNLSLAIEHATQGLNEKEKKGLEAKLPAWFSSAVELGLLTA